jgi:predicted metal-binding membrane protein
VRRAAPGSDARLLGVIGGAWLLIALLDLSGLGEHVHHHRLSRGGDQAWVSVLLALAGWQIMLAAMMLPSSVPVIRHVLATTFRWRRARSLSLFLSGYLGVWTIFGMAAVAGDLWLHHVTTAWATGEVPEGAVSSATLLVAAAWQFSPVKRRFLRACRSPGFVSLGGRAADLGALRFGLRHGLACVGSCWALMLVMFAAGTLALTWMMFLAVVVLFEKALVHGHAIARPVGMMLAALALFAVAPLTVARLP